MDAFFNVASSFVQGIAHFFDLEVPYIGISFLQLFGGLLILKAIIVDLPEPGGPNM